MYLQLETSVHNGEGPFFYQAMSDNHWTPKRQPLLVVQKHPEIWLKTQGQFRLKNNNKMKNSQRVREPFSTLNKALSEFQNIFKGF